MSPIVHFTIMLKSGDDIKGYMSKYQARNLEEKIGTKWFERFSDDEGYMWVNMSDVSAVLFVEQTEIQQIGFKGGEQ